MSDLDNKIDDTANSGTSGTSENPNTTPSASKPAAAKTVSSHDNSSTTNEDWKDEEIRRLRQENASRRVSEKESQKQVDEVSKLAKDALEALNEVKAFKETFSKDLRETREKMQAAERRAITTQLEVEARKAGVADLEIFNKLIDHNELKVGNDGNVVGVDDVIKNLKQKHPVLFDNRKSNNTGNPLVVKPAPETKRDLSGLSKKDYKKEREAHLRNISLNY